MHIKSVKFENHEILGDLNLDFCNADGTPNNTIIIAGGNGIGKSVILNAIHTHLKQPINTIKIKTNFFETIDKTALEKIAKLIWGTAYEFIFNRRQEDNYFFDYKVEGKISQYGSLSTSQIATHFKTHFYPASLHFYSQPVSAVTNRTEDMPVISPVLGEDIAQTFNQTLVDIRTKDNSEVTAYARLNRTSPVPFDIIDSRSKVFKDCFDKFFNGKTLLLNPEVNTNIQFVENGKPFPIQSLSTGEKQIVYRAGSMLAHKTALTGSIILFDEPEISMHPDWQMKIVPFYRELLGEETQIIIATHSPFIIHGSPFAKKIIIQKDANGIREVMTDAKFHSYGEVAPLEIFNVNLWNINSEKEVILFVEGESDITILTEAWNKLFPNEAIFFELKNGYSKSHLSVVLKDDNVWKKSTNKKIIGLLDFDSAYNDWNGIWNGKSPKIKDVEIDLKKCLTKKHISEKGWASLLPVPDFRNDRACLDLKHESLLSIEFLFKDEKIPVDYLKNKKTVGGGSISIFKDNKKTEFSELTKTFNASDFDAFKPIFDLLKGIRDGQYD